jgi:hypothetical protein
MRALASPSARPGTLRSTLEPSCRAGLGIIGGFDGNPRLSKGQASARGRGRQPVQRILTLARRIAGRYYSMAAGLSWAGENQTDAKNRASGDRLHHPGHLFLVCARHRLGAQAPHADEHRLFPLGPLDSRLGGRAGVPLRQPRGAGSDRHGRFGSQVRHRHQPLLLGRRDSGDGVRRRFHDAVLLRLASALGPGVSQVPLR